MLLGRGRLSADIDVFQVSQTSVHLGLRGAFQMKVTIKQPYRRVLIVGILVSGLGLAGATIAVASDSALQHTPAVTQYTGCLDDGYLYQVAIGKSPLSKCEKNQTVTWNKAGPQGPIGLRGIQGPKGVPGAKGTTGRQGVAGAAGSHWTSGTGAPSGQLGTDGDFYLDTNSGDLYSHTSGTWTMQGNLSGAAGTPGTTGPSGAPGSVGPTGPAGPPGPTGTMPPWGSSVGYDSVTILPGQTGHKSVDCGTGYFTTGGGYTAVISGGPNDGLAAADTNVYKSLPEGNGWGVEARNGQQSSDSVKLTVYALCIKIG